MNYGIVSNCFRTQLEAGESLDSLVGQAEQRGFRFIELRQGSLGEFEEQAFIVPNRDLAELHQRFPKIQFNLAVEFPFLSPHYQFDEKDISGFLWATSMLSGEQTPHLRLVDLETTDDDLQAIGIENAVETILALTEKLTALNGILSLEHARQSWRFFEGAFSTARESMGKRADRLQLCFDPCNLLLAGDRPNQAEITASLNVDTISMVHFKQRKSGAILPDMQEGDVDWPAVINELNRLHYSGPSLFEVAPSENLWENLNASCDFLNTIGIE
ncbi:MAG: hypothetical protein Tsb009_04080 [Planctomycetaceae bacterium]